MVTPNSLSPKNRAVPLHLGVVSFLAGMATMMVEFAASRLLGNVFGTSNLVWAVIIGLILVYLTLGNYLGGKWADASPRLETLGFILGLAGLGTGVIPFVSRPILRASANAFDQLNLGLLAGSFSSVLLLFIIPITLLGMVTPFTLRLSIQNNESSGRVSGLLSAVSTLGSFVGTFITVLALIPVLGTYRTFILTAAFLLVLAVIILLKQKKTKHAILFAVICILLVLAGVTGFTGFDKASEGMIAEFESAYNYIQVLEIDGYRLLRLNEGQGMHSIYHPERYYYSGPWSQVLVAPFLNPGMRIGDVKAIAMIGLAAGTSARQASRALPNIKIDGIEIDPEIIETGKRYFGMDLPNLNPIAGDGRWEINRLNGPYQVISVDAYRAPYIPAHMVTREFFDELAEKLDANGVVVINIGRGGEDRSLVDALSSTLAKVFPAIFAVDLPGSFNTIVFACKNPQTSWQALAENYISMKYAPEDPEGILQSAIVEALNGSAAVRIDGPVFTDDLAPVEFITNRMVLDYLLNQEKELP